MNSRYNMDHSVSEFPNSKMYGTVITSNSIAGCYRQFNDLKKTKNKKQLCIKIEPIYIPKAM